MNGYIIEPMWFYWVRVLDNISGIALGALLLGLVATVMCFIAESESYFDEDEKMWRKRMRTAFVVAVLSAIIVVFVPSSETLIKMKLAEFGTYENVTIVVETIEDMTDKIIEQIK